MHTPARFLDLHVLQPVTAANLNRDDNNEPKTIQVGNTTRALVSSQSWRRPLRLAIETDLNEPAARTRMMPIVIADRLRDAGWPDDLAAFASAQIVLSAKKGGLKHNTQQQYRTQAMLYIPQDAADRLTELCETFRPELEEALTEHTASKKKTSPAPVLPTKTIAAELTRRTASISLFGRMLAELGDGHVESAVQTAPAFTVNASELQPDFFTAVEDWPQDDDPGSAHLQTAYLTGGLFYRYSTVNITELAHNHNDTTVTLGELIELYVWHFIMSMPRAKATSTAPHTIPDLVHYAVRDSRPISYSAAFEQPVKAAPQGGYTHPARQALADYATTIDRLVGTRRRIAHGHTIAGTPINTFGTHHTSFEDLAAACATAALTPTPAR
ncbi:type I-E CRISPR-associated protein Cas7/Cse4/CasC [Streptomyces hydrogenans]|uniref:type I-E CRISPR-associated protein Cas7/Cse4/CasC n=1 Tax=Streptomyces hydrogenans TaxID=1873719 RepID=UPI003695D044